MANGPWPSRRASSAATSSSGGSATITVARPWSHSHGRSLERALGAPGRQRPDAPSSARHPRDPPPALPREPGRQRPAAVEGVLEPLAGLEPDRGRGGDLDRLPGPRVAPPPRLPAGRLEAAEA